MTNKEALKKIQSESEEEVVEGLKLLRDVGDPKSLEVVIEVLRNHTGHKVRQEAAGLLNDLKDPKCVDNVIAMIQSEQSAEIRSILVSSIWQGTLSYESHISVLIDILNTDDYLVSIEAFTALEALIMGLKEEERSQVVQSIKELYLEAKEEKKPLIQELLSAISV